MPRKIPKPHQIEAFEFAKANDGRFLNASVPGMGKTLSTIMYMEYLDKWPVLVVTPPAVKGAWKAEFEEFTGHKAVIVEGQSLYEGELSHKMAIINYDILHHQKEWLIEQRFALVVFDECDTLANKATKWTAAAIAVGKHCPKVIGLSGTPIANRPSCFWAVLNLIRPDIFPDEREYLWRYCSPTYSERFGKWEYKGACRLPELHERLKPFMLRRDKSILNLPKQTVSIETIDMDDRETYDVLHKKYVGAIRDHGLFRTKGADKLSLLTNLLMLVARCKARATVLWIRKFLAENPNEKLIVFAIHKKFIDVIQRRAAAEDESIVINGSVSAAKRTKLIDQFQNDPSKRLAICNIKAAGAGVTLTAATTTVVVELPWTSRAVEQLNARNHRIGQDRDTRTIFLLTQDTIEAKLCAAIQTKAAIASAVIDGKPTHDMPLMTMLEESLTQ